MQILQDCVIRGYPAPRLKAFVACIKYTAKFMWQASSGQNGKRRSKAAAPALEFEFEFEFQFDRVLRLLGVVPDLACPGPT